MKIVEHHGRVLLHGQGLSPVHEIELAGTAKGRWGRQFKFGAQVVKVPLVLYLKRQHPLVRTQAKRRGKQLALARHLEAGQQRGVGGMVDPNLTFGESQQ